jgi:branched-chain amino acid transport system ATP-binding protein
MVVSDKPWTERFAFAVRHPVRWMDDMCGDGPLYALLILFGLNATDELSRAAFGVLSPDIAEYFGIGLTGITVVVLLGFGAALALTIPIAGWSDRYNRVKLALLGGIIWSLFSVGIGLVVNAWVLGVMLAGSQIGKAVIDPTHNSLLADYYPMELRPRIYSFHRAANSVGQFIGPITAGLLATWFSWRVPFIVFAFPTLIHVVLGLRLKEPVRGERERRAMGATDEAALTEEEPPSFAEAWRMCWKIDSLRRIYRTLPFLAPAIVGFIVFAAFYYEEIFGLDAAERGFVGTITEPFQFVGLYIGARLGMKMFAKDPSALFRFLSYVVFFTTASAVMFAFAPNIVVAVIANIFITSSLAFLLPGIFAALSLAIPARSRSMGFSMGSVFVLPGLAFLPIIGLIGQVWGLRVGMLAMTPMFLFGGLAIATAGQFIKRDINNVWTASAALSEVAHKRRKGEAKLLLVRDLDVAYGDVQVLFGIDFEVDEGEIVALLGTNGAGKSTLLKAISGIVEADKGAVILDGRDSTHAPPNEIAALGVLQIPGGQGVFPSLSVAENLRIAGWMNRGNRHEVADDTNRVYDEFPILGERRSEPAANLSGGQQQMLAIGMAFLTRPKLLMIDELSLGLAPVVVEQLLPMIRRLRDEGTTIILVEQSVNIALTLASEAYFMEKGEIRFHGPTSELLERPDVLRSVFLEGAESGMRAAQGGNGNGAEPDRLGAVAVGSPTATSGNGGGARADTVAEAGMPDETSALDSVPALEIVEVSRRFGGIRAVDDVTLNLASGEVVGIIGPIGAGKTTLFDLVSGFTPIDTGRLVLNGVDVTSMPANARARLGLGRSFQDAKLFPSLTVEETVKVALDRWTEVRDPMLAALHLPAVFDSEEKVQHDVDELIELLGLEAFRTKFVRELSTGSRRIVDLACIVAHRPNVVLLDEPSSGIAQRETEALGPMILRIREQLGAAIIVIEHDMPLITAVSDRLVALDQGHVVTEGSADQVLHHPDVIASYLGNTDEVIARSGARASS